MVRKVKFFPSIIPCLPFLHLIKTKRKNKMESTCEKCSYEWQPRKENPKACPRCKTRLDYVIKKEAM